MVAMPGDFDLPFNLFCLEIPNGSVFLSLYPSENILSRNDNQYTSCFFNS